MAYREFNFDGLPEMKAVRKIKPAVSLNKHLKKFLETGELPVKKAGNAGITSPSGDGIHTDVHLTGVASKYLQTEGYVTEMAMPVVPVPQSSGKYRIFPKEDWLRADARKRSRGTPIKRMGYGVDSIGYDCEELSAATDITIEDKANQDPEIRLNESGAQFVTNKIMRTKEVEFQETFLQTGLGWDDQSLTNFGGKWNSSTTNLPRQITQLKERVHEKTDFVPNKMILGQKAFNTAIHHNSVLARLGLNAGATSVNPALITLQQLEMVFGVNIMVMSRVKEQSTQAAPDATTKPTLNPAFINPEAMLLYYAPDGLGLDRPTAMFQTVWNLFGSIEVSSDYYDREKTDQTLSKALLLTISLWQTVT